MKKIYLALMCMASLAIVTACGGGNANKGGEAAESENNQTEVATGDAPESINHTKWLFDDDTADYNTDYELVFSSEGNDVRLNYYTSYEDESKDPERDTYYGEFTYDNGKGSIEFTKDEESTTATFTVIGNKKEIVFKGKTFEMREKPW